MPGKYPLQKTLLATKRIGNHIDHRDTKMLTIEFQCMSGILLDIFLGVSKLDSVKVIDKTTMVEWYLNNNYRSTRVM